MSPIKAAASAKNMRFGTAFFTGDTYLDNAYLGLMQEHCNVAVSENEHKWGDIRRNPPPEYRWQNGDTLVLWAQQNMIDYRFHVLLWEVEERYPDWFASYNWGTNEAAEAERLLTDHIETVARRSPSDFYSWDVVNEAVDNTSGAYRETPFSRRLGGMENVVELAFRTARAELPTAQLVYNDFMSWNSWSENHRTGVLRLLENMLAKGVPIDALGLQSHVWGPRSGGEEATWRAFLKEVTDMGLELTITELDIEDQQLSADIETRDQEIADTTKAYLEACFEFDQLRDVLCWGLVHRYSWLQTFQQRADGLQKRGLPFADDYRPTLMAEAILETFEGATARS
ncbi:endo-1,4-beta-xylanase [Parvularcula maris]|uniref:endo-1,4-beta-xylanase n=1 Tax=Parvularcula maris TaxID=2965077 RepID=UPI002115225A